MNAAVPGRGAPAPLLQLCGITKAFGKLLANDHIDLDVQQGEVHALLGENGAGKTTLMNILYGLYRPDSGEIRLHGAPVHIASPRDAIRQRIGMVHQHFMLIPNLSVVENIILGLPLEGQPYLNLKRAAAKVSDLAARYGLSVDPFALVSDLPVGVQQRVEILKTLYRGVDLLILDEPTAVLTPLEVNDFFSVLKRLVEQGLAAIFISHKLNEVLEVSQRITVLRRGRKVGTLPQNEANLHILAEMMVGREVLLQVRRPQHQRGGVRLEVKDLSSSAASGRKLLKGINLDIYAGEVLGIAGVDGNGQQELAEALAGLRPTQQGHIVVDGAELTNRPAQEFFRHGVGYIPADRQQDGLVMDFSIADNLVIKRSDAAPFGKGGVLRPGVIRSHARRVIDEFDVRAGGEDEPARQLSGGNQQKVILAREIEDNPGVLIAMHPTRGLDIGAMEYVQKRLLEQCALGTAVMLISTEMEELLALCDRIAVMFRGELMGILTVDSQAQDRIARMMLGERMESPVGDEQ
jgi:general nucleoside transport system ATP-binding protein